DNGDPRRNGRILASRPTPPSNGLKEQQKGRGPPMKELHFRSASELGRMMRRGEISSLELTDHFIARIEALDGKTNAVVARDFGRARKLAREADAALARGQSLGALHGLPMTIKDAYEVEGIVSTGG